MKFDLQKEHIRNKMTVGTHCTHHVLVGLNGDVRCQGPRGPASRNIRTSRLHCPTLALRVTLRILSACGGGCREGGHRDEQREDVGRGLQ
jgi:hypothetical protein